MPVGMILTNGSTTITSPGCSMSMTVWMRRRPGPFFSASACMAPATSGRVGMNCTVKARPTSFLPGFRIFQSGKLIGKTPTTGLSIGAASSSGGAPAAHRSLNFLNYQILNLRQQVIGNLGTPVRKTVVGIQRRVSVHLFVGQRELAIRRDVTDSLTVAVR